MDINIKETLRELRRKKNITQEALANHLGITPQSVGKWERGEGFPDITLLPAIALYFGISVDELLGVEKARIEDKIAKYENQAHALKHVGKVEEAAKILEQAYAEFPNDCGVMESFMSTLYFIQRTPIEDERAALIEELGERILEESKVTSQRESAIQILTYLYNENGDKETALKYADMGGSLFTTMYDLRSSVLDGDEGVGCTQSYIQDLLLLVSLAAVSITRKVEMTPEERIRVYDFSVKARLLPFDKDENIGYCGFGVSDDLMQIAYAYAELGKYDDAYDALERSVRYAVMTTQRQKKKYKSFMVNRLEDDPDSGTKNYEGNACDLRLNAMGHGAFDPIRGDERFLLIRAELLAHTELAHD